MKSAKEYLDVCISEHLASLIQEKDLKKVAEKTSDGWAMLRYKSGAILLNITYDRGLYEFEISPSEGPENFFEVEQIGRLVEPDLYMGKQGTVRLGLKDKVQLLSKSWDQLQDLYSLKNYKGTRKKIEGLISQRTNKNVSG